MRFSSEMVAGVGGGVEEERLVGAWSACHPTALKRYLQDLLKSGLDCSPVLPIFYGMYDVGNPLLVQGGIIGLGPPSMENVFVLSSQYFIPKS